MIETLRNYMQLAAGLLESTSERALDSASILINQGVEATSKGPEVVTTQVQGIAEDLIEQSRVNRELVVGLVRTEVERSVGRMGFVREEELAAVRKHVERLERQLNQRGDQAADAATLAVSTAASAVPVATKAAAKATGSAVKASKAAASAARGAASSGKPAAPAASKAPAKKTTAKKTTAKKAPAKKTTAKKAPAKKTTAKKAPAKKAPAKKTARKTTARKGS